VQMGFVDDPSSPFASRPLVGRVMDAGATRKATSSSASPMCRSTIRRRSANIGPRTRSRSVTPRVRPAQKICAGHAQRPHLFTELLDAPERSRSFRMPKFRQSRPFRWRTFRWQPRSRPWSTTRPGGADAGASFSIRLTEVAFETDRGHELASHCAARHQCIRLGPARFMSRLRRCSNLSQSPAVLPHWDPISRPVNLGLMDSAHRRDWPAWSAGVVVGAIRGGCRCRPGLE